MDLKALKKKLGDLFPYLDKTDINIIINECLNEFEGR